MGLKFQELGGRLVGSFDYYHQTRPQLQGGGTGTPVNVVNTVGEGEELEIRWVATKNFSFTFAGNMQRTVVRGPDNSFAYLPAATVCGANQACYVNSFGASSSPSPSAASPAARAIMSTWPSRTGCTASTATMSPTPTAGARSA